MHNPPLPPRRESVKHLGAPTTLLLLAMSWDCGKPTAVVTNQQEAIKAIERWGGTVSTNGVHISFDRYLGDDWPARIRPQESRQPRGPKLTDAGLENVKWFPQLEDLHLVNTEVTDAGLKYVKGLTQLTGLGLYGAKVKGDGLVNLVGLTRLHALSLDKTQVNDASLTFIEGLTGLRTLGLMNTRVTDAGLEHLKGLTQLRDLRLDGTMITDVGLEHLKGLHQLKDLSLKETKVTDAGLKHLEGLTNLEKLDLEGTQVTDAGLSHLDGMPKLTRLFFKNTRITYEGMKTFKNFKSAFDSIWKPGMPIPVYITPFYNSQGPQINVGAFSKQLATADAKTITDVAAEMKKQWGTLPVEAMFVAAIRHYDLGQKDDAVYWFYSATYRARLFASILSDSNPKRIGASAFEATSAHGAFHQLAGEYINGYAGGNVDKWKATIKAVQSESGKTIPTFTLIYPTVSFIPAHLWADKNKEVAAGLSRLLNYIETHAEEIKAKRKQSGVEGKY